MWSSSVQVHFYNETDQVFHHGNGNKIGLIEAFKNTLGHKIYCSTTPGEFLASSLFAYTRSLTKARITFCQ